MQAQSPSASEAEVLSESPVAPTTPAFFASEQVRLSETYPGSVFVAGGQVDFSGETYGDLLVAGGSVFIDGLVNQDLYVGGGTVVMSGEVLGNVVVAGGEVRFLPTAVVAGSVISAGESIQLDGTFQQQSFVFGRVIEFLGTFRSDVHVDAEEIVVREGALIQGFMTGKSPQEVALNDSSQVTRGVAVEVAEKMPRQSSDSFYWWLSKLLMSILSLSIILLVIVSLFGKKLARISMHALQEWQSSLLSGVLLFMSLLVGALFLLATVFGVQASLMLLFAGLGISALGWVVPAFFLGQWILPTQNRYLQAVFGASAVGVFVSLPIIGWVFAVFLTVFGAGALFREFRRE